MMKLTHRYGCRLLCGWLPPVPIVADDDNNATAPAPGTYSALFKGVAGRLPWGEVALAGSADASRAWVCAGNCGVVNVTCSTPAESARVTPLPMCTGTRPCRSGRPNVDWPSPP